MCAEWCLDHKETSCRKRSWSENSALNRLIKLWKLKNRPEILKKWQAGSFWDQIKMKELQDWMRIRWLWQQQLRNSIDVCLSTKFFSNQSKKHVRNRSQWFAWIQSLAKETKETEFETRKRATQWTVIACWDASSLKWSLILSISLNLLWYCHREWGEGNGRKRMQKKPEPYGRREKRRAQKIKRF